MSDFQWRGKTTPRPRHPRRLPAPRNGHRAPLQQSLLLIFIIRYEPQVHGQLVIVTLIVIVLVIVIESSARRRSSIQEPGSPVHGGAGCTVVVAALRNQFQIRCEGVDVEKRGLMKIRDLK